MSEYLYIDFNIIHQNEDVEPLGINFQAAFNASYHQLVDTFGLPISYPARYALADNKVEVEWKFNYGDGVIATIYNWKNGKNYDPEKGIAVEDMTEWHIGGHDFKALLAVIKSIDDKLQWNLKQLEDVYKTNVDGMKEESKWNT